MSKIYYLKGDATNPMTKGIKIIAHICNDSGGWGKGFVLALSRKWQAPEQAYRKWYSSKSGFKLGEIQLIQVNPYTYIGNLIGQKGTKTGSKGPPIRYNAVEECLTKLATEALRLDASVHMPRIGCGLAGGKWELIEPIIRRTLVSKNIKVYVYDFE